MHDAFILLLMCVPRHTLIFRTNFTLRNAKTNFLASHTILLQQMVL